jgi:hypothetical protein
VTAYHLLVRRRSIAQLALLIGAIATVAGCGPTATATPPPTQAPPTAAPTASVQPLPTFAAPSFVGDSELEAMFPDAIGGIPLDVVSISGSEIPVTGGMPQLTKVLDALGKGPSDLSVAFAGTPSVTIQAFRVKGVPATRILPALITVYQQQTPSTTSEATFAGKRVTKFTPTSGSDPAVYVYVTGDTVFTVGGAEATDPILTEVFTKLP